VFLFSDAANFVTGQTLVGGFLFPEGFTKYAYGFLVDGAAWRVAAGNPGRISYPDFLLSDEVFTRVMGGKKSKL
jgi:hypothetical protein